MRLIDADKLKDFINEWLSYDYKIRVDLTSERVPNKWLKSLIKCVDRQPTVDVLEQIRNEIDRLHYHPKLDFIKNDEVVEMALDIIDKYIGK